MQAHPPRLTARNVFVDCHGVITDGERVTAEWRRLLAEFFVPRLGGMPEAWAEANRHALARTIERLQRPGRVRTHPRDYWREDDLVWLADMCEQVGVPTPARGFAGELVREAVSFVTAHADASRPGAPEALRELARRGYVLYTASGDLSENLDRYLRRLGARDLFRETYGSDLVGTWKDGPEFYRAVLAHSGVRAHDALIIDDQPRSIEWARQCGIAGILVSPDRPPRSLADVAGALS